MSARRRALRTRPAQAPPVPAPLSVRLYFLGRAARVRATETRPSDTPSLWVEGREPFRVLVAGAGLAAGYGVPRWRESFAGALANHLGLVTARGVRVDIRTSPTLPARRAVDRLGPNGAHSYDAVVFAPCYLEASFAPESGMARHARAIQEHLLATGGARLQRVLLLGIPRPSRYSKLNLAATEAATITNRALRREAGTDERVHYLEPPDFESLESGTPFDARYYATLGRAVATELLDALRPSAAPIGLQSSRRS